MSGPLIHIEGDESRFVSLQGDTVLRSALRQGLGFPYECNSGGCGRCAFDLVSGALDDIWPEAPGLSERARQRGRRLACQSVALDDCRIKVSLKPDFVPEIAPRRFEVALTTIRPLTADMAEFTFAANAPAAFSAGQYAMVHLPLMNGERAYSMSNIANAKGEWRFIIKRVPKGKATTELFEVSQIGKRFMVDAPYGLSYLRAESPRDVICIAGGSGLSPVLSVLRAAVADPRFAGRRLILFYGGRSRDDLCARAEIDADPTLRGRVELHTAISDPQSPGAAEWQGARGFIHDHVREVIGDALPEYEFYFCGPPPMIDAVHRMLLLEKKVAGAQLHFDRFL